MNSNCIGRNKESVNCSLYGGSGIWTPVHLKSYGWSQKNLLHGIGCSPDYNSLYRPFLDLYDNNPDYFRDENTDFEILERYDIDELLMVEQMMFEQQVHMLRRINQLKQELYSEYDSTCL